MEVATKYDCRNPIFRVYHRGKLLCVGTAKDLQLLFNTRHRALKQKLLRQVAMDYEEQMELKYQVELDAEYQQEKADLLAYAEEAQRQTEPRFVRPDDFDEECAMYQPNSEEKIERIRKQQCRHRRYRLKRLVPERYAAAMEAPDLSTFIYSDSFEIEVPYGEVPMYVPKEDTPVIGQRRKNGGIDWATKRTPIEEAYLKEKREKLGLRTRLYI